MKFLLQNRSTSEFYRGEGKWTGNASEAKVFYHSDQAMRECQAKQLNAEIVMGINPNVGRPQNYFPVFAH